LPLCHFATLPLLKKVASKKMKSGVKKKEKWRQKKASLFDKKPYPNNSTVIYSILKKCNSKWYLYTSFTKRASYYLNKPRSNRALLFFKKKRHAIKTKIPSKKRLKLKSWIYINV
jgi:hypothetical protein